MFKQVVLSKYELGYILFLNKCEPFIIGPFSLYIVIASLSINKVWKTIKNYSIPQPAGCLCST